MTNVIISPKHKALVVPSSAQLANLFPDAPRLTHAGNDMMVVPYRPGETALLRNLGYDADAPILHTYDWAGGKPFEVQRKTCAMLTMNPRAYVLNGMGTGKTKAGLWAWDYLYSIGAAKKLLVLAPLSTLKFTWGREVFATLPHRKYTVLHGTKAQRLARLQDPEPDIYIINHDGVRTVKDEIEKLVADGVIDTLILDELSVYRNAKAERTKLMVGFASKFTYVWGMTGSPMPNEPTDVWALAKIITPHTVPKYFRSFRDELMLKITQFKYVPKQDATQKAFDVMTPAVRYTLDDILELPEEVTQTIEVDMGPKQAKIYKALADTCHAMLERNEVNAANAGALLVKLMQVATGWVYDEKKNVVALDGDERIDALIDAIGAAEGKVLVFTPFKHTLAGISAALTKAGIEHATVSGDTPAGERADIFNLFQNTTKFKVIAAHPATMAHGLTLTAANVVIWFAPITSLEIFEQANARIRRVGQQMKQLYLQFVGSPVERKLYAMLHRRQSVQDGFLELFEEATRMEH